MKKDISDMDWYVHSICDLLVILYALVSFRFRFLRQYLMIVFYFFTCIIYIGNSYFERTSYTEFRINLAELMIFYFCVCQMITSSNWVLETVCCNLFMLVTLYGMTFHMRDPQTPEEAESYIPVDALTFSILVSWISFIAFTVVNRFILERRERILYLAKTAT